MIISTCKQKKEKQVKTRLLLSGIFFILTSRWRCLSGPFQNYVYENQKPISRVVSQQAISKISLFILDSDENGNCSIRNII